MKKLLVALLAAAIVLVCAWALVGFGRSKAGSGGTIAVGGASTTDVLARALLEAFMFDSGSTTATYTSGTSREGVIGVQQGAFDLAFTSWLPEGTALEAVLFTCESICIITHPDNPVTDVTTEELRGIFDGSITNWAQLGGEDKPIAVMGRQGGSGTRESFERALGAESYRYDVLHEGAGRLVQAVGANEAAIGFAAHLALDGKVAVLAVDGVRPATEEWPYTECFYIVYDPQAAAQSATPRLLEFIQATDTSMLIEVTRPSLTGGD